MTASSAIDWFPLWLSLRVVALATIFVLVFGTFAAYWLSHKNFRGKNAVDSLITLPLVLPPTVLGYYLLVLIGRTSPIGHIYEAIFGQPLVFTWQAAVVAAILHSAPIYIKAARAIWKAWITAMNGGAQPWRFRVAHILAGDASVSLARFKFTGIAEFRPVLRRLRGDNYGGRNIPGRTQTLSVAIFDAVESGTENWRACWCWWFQRRR